MTEVMLWDPVVRGLWGVAITVLFMAGLQYLIKGRKREVKNERIMMYGFAAFLWSLTSSRIFFYVYEILMPGNFINGTFYGKYPVDESELTIFLLIVGSCFDLSSLVRFTLFFLAFEIVMKRTKYIISITCFAYIVFYVFFVMVPSFMYYMFQYEIIPNYYENIKSWFMTTWLIFQAFCLVIVFLMCYYITKWSRLEFKGVTSLLAFGYLIIYNGLILGLNIKLLYGLAPLFLSPIIVIIGTLVFISPTIISPKFISRALNFWKILGISILCFYFLLNFYYIYIGIPIDYFGIVFDAINLGLFMYLIIKNIKSEMISETREPDPKSISRALAFWKIAGTSLICIYFRYNFYKIYEGIPIDYVTIAYSVILYVPLIFIIIKNIKSEMTPESKEEIKEKRLDVLGAFIKPQRITEEEVSVSKEKKICLVCKGTGLRFTYICPECNAIYCQKCARALSDLENACWVCSAPFEESKPSKPFEKEKVEEVMVEEDDSKKVGGHEK